METELQAALQALVDGVEIWAGQEEGVHPDCWTAYCRACALLGHQIEEGFDGRDV